MGIENSHRAKLMQLDEERLNLTKSDEAITAVTKEHQCEMSAMAHEHEQKMDIMKNAHAARMAKYKTPMPIRPIESSPPSDFGVVTGQCLWDLGMPDGYVNKTNL